MIPLLNGTLTLTHGPQPLGRYNAQGLLLNKTRARRAVEKPLVGKVKTPEEFSQVVDEYFPISEGAYSQNGSDDSYAEI